jgi:hypothetical protein
MALAGFDVGRAGVPVEVITSMERVEIHPLLKRLSNNKDNDE